MAKRRTKKKSDNTQHVADLERHLARRGPGNEEHAPTPERIAHALEAGNALCAHVLHNERGFPTADFHWQITPVIDMLEKRGTLTPEEYDVALRYMRHYAGSRHKGPATARYLPNYDSGMRDMEPAERAMEMGQLRALAEAAVDPVLRPALRWLEAAAEDEMPLWMLGAMFYPDASRSVQATRAPAILHVVISMLARHYRRPARFAVHEVDTAVRRFRMTRTTVEIEERIR